MELKIDKKNMYSSVKTGFIMLIFFTLFSILAQLYNDYLTIGVDLVNIIQTLLPYLIYISMLYILGSILLLAIGEFGKRG